MSSSNERSPSDALAEAVERGDAAAIAREIAGLDFTLVETPEESLGDDRAALTAEVDDFPVLVAFTSEEHAALFADGMPDMLAEDGTLPGFVVEGSSLLAYLPDGFGLMLDPETKDCLILPPALVAQVKAARQPGEAIPSADPLQEQTFQWLEARGFRPARWLPPPDTTRIVRPAEEIASRLMALAALVTWVTAPKEAAPAEKLSKYIQRSRLRNWLTAEDTAILTTTRAEARRDHGDAIGWKLENMWPLAWVLGFAAEPTIDASQIVDDVSRAILFEFVPGLDGAVGDLLNKSRLRSAEEVIGLEYRFYCAHNAVRSAQLGEDTVPEGFHPFVHGGAVHERRHALTWCLSLGIAWDETDLST